MVRTRPMRYIGNKTRLLPFIAHALRTLRIPPGSAHDAFAGTAAVGRALKESGWRVASSDLMTYSYVFQRAYVVASRCPDFSDLADADRAVGDWLRAARVRSRKTPAALAAIGSYLATGLEPVEGFL